MFVKEVERAGHDRIYWVRREATFALGALAKIVPEEIVFSSLVSLFFWTSLRSPAYLLFFSPASYHFFKISVLIPFGTSDSLCYSLYPQFCHVFHLVRDAPRLSRPSWHCRVTHPRR